AAGRRATVSEHDRAGAARSGRTLIAAGTVGVGVLAANGPAVRLTAERPQTRQAVLTQLGGAVLAISHRAYGAAEGELGDAAENGVGAGRVDGAARRADHGHRVAGHRADLGRRPSRFENAVADVARLRGGADGDRGLFAVAV